MQNVLIDLVPLTEVRGRMGTPVKKHGIPKGLAPGRRFAYFLDEEKVGRRRPTHGCNQIVLDCRIAARNNLS